MVHYIDPVMHKYCNSIQKDMTFGATSMINLISLLENFGPWSFLSDNRGFSLYNPIQLICDREIREIIVAKFS